MGQARTGYGDREQGIATESLAIQQRLGMNTVENEPTGTLFLSPSQSPRPEAKRELRLLEEQEAL